LLVAKWILFLIIGKIVIHIWMQFEFPDFLKKNHWLSKLHGCPLCSGVWIYTILSFFLGVDLLSVTLFIYVPIVSEIVTGILAGWAVWLFSLGWSSAYDVVIIE
jgi:hypothetical protein